VEGLAVLELVGTAKVNVQANAKKATAQSCFFIFGVCLKKSNNFSYNCDAVPK